MLAAGVDERTAGRSLRSPQYLWGQGSRAKHWSPGRGLCSAVPSTWDVRSPIGTPGPLFCYSIQLTRVSTSKTTVRVNDGQYHTPGPIAEATVAMGGLSIQPT